MDKIPFEEASINILKKIFLAIVGSGLFVNALYIYGLSYYEGYVKNLGFDHIIFPLELEDALLWTYTASRELGTSTLSFWSKTTWAILLPLLVLFYLIVRLWMALSSLGAKKQPTLKSRYLALFLIKARKIHPYSFKFVYPTFKWFFIAEQSFWAFLSSYFALVALIFIPSFIFIWAYFPLIGLKHGMNTGKEQFNVYQKNLCNSKIDYWTKCIKISTDHIKREDLPKFFYGRLIAKNGSLIGLITADGPITMTIPPLFFQQTRKNEYHKSNRKNNNDQIKPTYSNPQLTTE